MMSSDDEEGGKTHFSLKDITAKEKKESGKKKRRKRKLEEGDAVSSWTCIIWFWYALLLIKNSLKLMLNF